MQAHVALTGPHAAPLWACNRVWSSLLATAQHWTGPCRAGLLLATGGDDNLVKVWHADRDQALHTLEGHTREVSCVRWSPSGAGSRQHTLISTSYDNTARSAVAICDGDCAH